MSATRRLSKRATLAEVRSWLIDYVCWQLERAETLYAPNWRLPALFAGHPVGADVRGDLVFNLGMLHELGITALAGGPVADAIGTVLAPLDGPATHSFYSYRVAETLLRFGQFDEANGLLADLDVAARENLAAAVDSTEMVDQLGVSLPRNYVAVLARCELARERLGLVAPSPHLETLVSGVRTLLGGNPRGFIDDSNDGSGRFDIYLADVYLFTEPLSDRLGGLWDEGLTAASALVLKTMTRDGTSIPWGRSTGALGVVLSAELAAINLGRRRAPEAGTSAAWGDALLRACRSLPDWFGDGLIASHQHRSTYGYRGPYRRLQMTFDVLGKLLQSAIELGRLSADELDREVNLLAQPTQDELVTLSDATGARVWSFSSPALRLVLPLVGGGNADYLPAPRNPGTLEVPVDSQLATMVPVVSWGSTRCVPAGPPVRVEKREGGLALGWDELFELRRDFGAPSGIRSSQREVAYRVEGASLHVSERLTFADDDVPTGVTLQVAERRERPLAVRFDAHAGHASRIDVDGLKEYRSFWGEFSVVHQLDLEPAAAVEFSYSITPRLRLMTNALEHHYHRSLYDPIAADVYETQFPWRNRHEMGDLHVLFEHIDQFHLHWPEHFLRGHHDTHVAVIDALQRSDVRIVCTQHNLIPHDPRQRDGAHALYQLWADAADGIVHHSESGRRRIRERYQFRDDVVERVITHGHFGNLIEASAAPERSAVEAQLGLAPTAIRIGIVGAPRAEKNVQQVLDAFAACTRADLQLYVTCLAGSERVPEDVRIISCEYEMVARELYDARLAAIDVLVLPIEPGDLLTTGVIGDAIGAGIAAICTRWDFLVETLGDAAITYDGTAADLTRVFEQLDAGQLRQSAAALRALQPRHDWNTIAVQHLEFLRAVGTRKV